MRQQVVESEQELTDHFTSALGVGAQSYEASNGRPDPGAAARAMESDDFSVIANERRHARRHREALAVHGAVEATLAIVGREDARTLRLAFYPRQTVGAGPYQAGHKSLALLGLETNAARDQHAAWVAQRPGRAGVGLLEWLDAEATRDNPPQCRKEIRNEAEIRLHRALARYDVLRRERVRIEKTARQASKDAAAARVSAAMGNRPSVRIKASPRAELVNLSSLIAALLADHQDLLDADAAE